MEVFWLVLVWVISLYIIRLHLELHAYRKYFSQHNDIYVPTYQELSKVNSWNFRPFDSALSQIKKESKSPHSDLIPIYKKKLVTSSVYIKE